MPYITPDRRDELEPMSEAMSVNAGELNFQITCLLKDYLAANKTTYGRINDCLGALEGAKLEFYRRVVVPYEESKRATNGDVY